MARITETACSNGVEPRKLKGWVEMLQEQLIEYLVFLVGFGVFML